jgi:hypothetical protein
MQVEWELHVGGGSGSIDRWISDVIVKYFNAGFEGR